MRELGGRPKHRQMHWFVLPEACILDFYLEGETTMCNLNQIGVELKH